MCTYNLQDHLQNYQYLNFHGNDKLVNIIKDDSTSRTMLTQFVYMNHVDEDAKKRLNLLYIQFLEYFGLVWQLVDSRFGKRVVGSELC